MAIKVSDGTLVEAAGKFSMLHPCKHSRLHKAHILNLNSPLDGLLHAENRLLLSFFIFEKSGVDF